MSVMSQACQTTAAVPATQEAAMGGNQLSSGRVQDKAGQHSETAISDELAACWTPTLPRPHLLQLQLAFPLPHYVALF